MVLPDTAPPIFCVPSVAAALPVSFTFSSKVSTILPLADALVEPSAGTVFTSTGALPSLTSWAVPVM